MAFTATTGAPWPALTESFSRQRIAAYADAGGDHNPIHVDDDVARAVGLPGVIAHGLLTMSCLARAVTSQLERPEQMRSLSTRFAGMVFPDTEVTFAGTVTSAGGGRAEIELWATEPAGARVLNRARAIVEV
jgi:acyl dehydratase